MLKTKMFANWMLYILSSFFCFSRLRKRQNLDFFDSISIFLLALFFFPLALFLELVLLAGFLSKKGTNLIIVRRVVLYR